ncbi:hypothetical protein SFMTTN_2076 [Sulfuriferula multivorans]|uniref:DUF2730 family protein n=1 Tax=Sulfuriferula multivorans TaxID=1559896 RepID=A0A401JF85_9PROT|nr:DUF2730 family protein [Sulfuriferula multivorans]GBL46263.1 hypothetical protein SFMTTN_2076 [Sulfuriferula multivorans]
MDYKGWIDTLQFLIMSAVGVWMYLERKNDKAHERITALETVLENNIARHADRLMKIETQIEGLPSQNDIGKVYERVQSIDQRISHIEGQFVGSNHTLNLIHEYLMKEKS